MASEAMLKPIQAHAYPLALQSSLTKKAPVFFISLFGNVLEYFEYTIYGFLAPVLALHFFPSDDPTVSLIKAFGIIAVGSCAKPLGALIFGYLGDTKGRSITLRYTMIGIAIPTFIVGTLPGYVDWGWKAVLALVLCRMFQGIFMAAESDGVRIYVYEHFGHQHPCLISASISCSAYTGMAIAALVASHIPTEGDAWRWAFFASGLYALLVYTLRRQMIETPPFLRLQNQAKPYISLKTIIQTHWASLLRTIIICGAVGGIYHFYFVFQCTYLSTVLHLLSPKFAPQLSVYLICFYVCCLPIAGLSADRWGYVRIGKIGGIATIVLTTINAIFITDGTIFFPFMFLTTAAMAFFVAPGYLFLTQQYDVHIRFRSFCLGHAIGSMLFSGTTPFVCLTLWKITALAYAPYLYFLLLMAAGTTAFIWRAKDNAYNAWFL